MFCIKCGTQLDPLEQTCPNCGFDMKEEDLEAGIMQALEVEPRVKEEPGEDAEALAEALLQAQKVEELDLENILADNYDMESGIEDLTEEEIYRSWANVPEEEPIEDVPKRKKLWAVLAGVFGVLVILGLGAFFGIRYYQNELTYEKAVACLEQRQYDEALSLFMSLGDFKDSASYTGQLQEKFQAYNNAVNGMKSGKFDGVEEVFASLGDFMDSQQMLETGITWNKAEYLLRCAQNKNKAGMELLAGVDDTTEDYLVWVLMFMSAKEHYSQIPEYKDAAEKIQLCYLGAARVLAYDGQMDAALVYKDMMNEASQALFMEEVRALCADDAFLQALKTSLQARKRLDAEGSEDLRRAVQTEQSYIGKYQNIYFLDKNLQKIAFSYMEGVYLQWIALDGQGRCVDTAAWARGEYQRRQAVRDLFQQYGFLAEDKALADYYMDGLDAARAQYQIHSSIATALAENLEGIGRLSLNAAYKNDSGYAFNVTFTFTFYQENEQVAQTTVTMAMGKGQEKTLKGKAPNTDYDRWSLSWQVFDVTGNGQVDVSGVYGIYSMLMLEYDSLFLQEDLEAAGRGDDSVELYEDGTGVLTTDGAQRSIQYENGVFWFTDTPEEKIPFQVLSGTLTFTLGETEYTYQK